MVLFRSFHPVTPPTHPYPFLLMHNLTPKDIAESDVIKPEANYMWPVLSTCDVLLYVPYTCAGIVSLQGGGGVAGRE